MCTSVCVLQLRTPSQAVSFRKRERGGGGGVGRRRKWSCADAIAIKEEGAVEKMFQSRETGGWAWGAAPRGGGRVWLLSQPGRLAADQLTLEKASSLEQD